MSDNAANKASMQIITRLERENTRLRAELSEALAALGDVRSALLYTNDPNYHTGVEKALALVNAILAKHKDSTHFSNEPLEPMQMERLVKMAADRGWKSE